MGDALFAAEPAPRPGAAEAPLDAAVRSAVRFLLAVAAVLAVAWLASGIRQVEPGSQAVVLRFGAIDRTAQAGLVLAWPRPFEEVAVLPARERQQTLEVDRLDLRPDADDQAAGAAGGDARRGGGYVLTGDAGVAHLRATIAWQVADPRAYLLAHERVAAGLERAAASAAIHACAARGLDGVMVAGLAGAAAGSDERLAASRERLRGDLLALLNRRLADMGLGVEAVRVDLVAALPPRARPSFDAVVEAEAAAARDIAEARTAAARAAQEADSEAERIRSVALARAQETVAAARIATDRIAALAAERDPQRRAQLIQRLHRERLESVLRALAVAGGSIAAVDGREPVRIWTGGR